MIKLINRTGKFKKELTNSERIILNNMGAFLVTKMNVHVAIDTGYLQSRNTYVINRNELFLMNDCDYAIHQEFGTHKMNAHPFMKPSALNYIADLKRIASEGAVKDVE